VSNPFEVAVPTYYENWPVGLRRLSMATAMRKMSVAEAQVLRACVGEHGEGLEKLGPLYKCADTVGVLINWMEEKIGEFPKGAFVRLGSRSPKDSWAGNRDGFRVEHGREAWDLLTDCSERVYDDLSWALKNDYEPCLLVREWLDIPRWMEFRCFMKSRKLVGISQYFYRDESPEIEKFKDSIKWALEMFFENLFVREIHLDDVVFDVFAHTQRRGNETVVDVKLIEINPYATWTDPCLFDWNEDAFDAIEFRTALGQRREAE
jgi:hypothetical protein